LAQAESLGAGRGEGEGGGDKLPYFCMLFPPPLSPLPRGEGKIYFLRIHQEM